MRLRVVEEGPARVLVRGGVGAGPQGVGGIAGRGSDRTSHSREIGRLPSGELTADAGASSGWLEEDLDSFDPPMD